MTVRVGKSAFDFSGWNLRFFPILCCCYHSTELLWGVSRCLLSSEMQTVEGNFTSCCFFCRVTNI